MRYGPGQSGPPPTPKLGQQAAGGAVLRRQTFQPENKKQQAELAQGVQQNAAVQQRQRAQKQLLRAYNRTSVLREQARQNRDGKTVALLDKKLAVMHPHFEALGLGPKPSKALGAAYGAVQRAEKVPVAGQLLSFADPIALAKTAIANVKSLPDIGTKKFGAGQVNAGMVFGKGGEIPKAAEADIPKPYVSTGRYTEQLPRGEKGFLYHKAPISAFHQIRAEGIKANKPRTDTPGTYFMPDPISAQKFAGKGSSGGIFFRVASDKLKNVEERAYRETIAPHHVPASDLEYFGSNGKWHPAVPQGVAAAEKVREALGPARTRYAAQKGLRREERGKRFGSGETAYEAAGGGVEGYYAKLGHLKGELPKVEFKNLREGNLTKQDLNGLLDQVQAHPALQEGEKTHAQTSLLRAFNEGRVPASAEQRHLVTVFGQDAVNEMVHISKLKRAGEIGLGVANIPRSLMASFDLSAPLRQGFGGMLYDPKSFAKTLAPMVKAAGSESFYQNRLAKLHGDAEYERAVESGVRFTELSPTMRKREEQFPSQYAERLNVPVGKGHSVGPGHIVRGSGRAYTLMLDEQRMALFKKVVGKAAKVGVNTEDRKFLRSTARFVNTLTGRGGLGKLEPAAPVLNTLIFSPRLMASRIDTFIQPLDPRLHSFVRHEAQKMILRLGAFGAGAAGVGLAAGGQVGYDPRSADFAKLKFGNTRIDPLAGYQQYIRFASQLYSGKVISSTTGKTLALGHGFGKMTREDVLKNFGTQKLAPLPSFLDTLLKQHGIAGQPINYRNEVVQRLTPLAIQDAYSTYQDKKNLPAGIGAYVGSGLGLGIQTYSKKKPKTRPPSSAPRRGSTNSLLRTGGSGSNSLLRH